MPPQKPAPAKKRNDAKWPRSPGFTESWKRFKANNPQISDAMTAFDRCKRAVPPNPLPGHMEDHKLTGPLRGFMDCHLDPDVILIYKTLPGGIIKLCRVCAHADLKGPKAKNLKKLIDL
jgi:mRNA interferase YafQ